jgi:spore coat polysaccharide biosynthesis protein SpsF
MGSTRLPGKTLHRVLGKPLLEYVVERLRQTAGLDAIVVATSDTAPDNEIADFSAALGIPVVRGPLDNVSERFVRVLEEHPLDAFVRVSADSPLLDQRLVSTGVALFRERKPDLVTNVHPRTYPKGQSVEVVQSSTFRRAYLEMTEADDLEHVTRFFYGHAGRFSILNFESGMDLGHIQLSIDTQEDLALFSKFMARMKQPHWEYSWEDVLAAYDSLNKERRGTP